MIVRRPASWPPNLLSQAEHGEDSQVILVTTSTTLARQVKSEVERQLSSLPRAKVARTALSQSRIIIADSLAEACEISNAYAPEHLIIQTENPRALLPKLCAAGSIFLGSWTPESAGDYASGTNHVLPTYGTARTVSSLSLADFQRRFTVQELTREGLAGLAQTITTLAEAEGLQAHARAVTLRLDQLGKEERDIEEQSSPAQLAQLAQLARLVRPEIAALVPYASARREASGGTVWLNANESPYNNVSAKNASANNNSLTSVNRYPECQPKALRSAYAEYAGVRPEQVLISRGADEGIDLLIRAFCRPGCSLGCGLGNTNLDSDSIATCIPSYGMYAVSAATNAVNCRVLEWAEGYQLPADFAAQVKDCKLVFVCNPNNPSGTVIAPDALVTLAQQLPDSLLVVDEAYIEFCPARTVAYALDQCTNLVVLRTLSKAFALAGARCGFTLAHADVIATLEKVIAPYPVPEPVNQLALAALSSSGQARMLAQVSELNERRDQLAERLQKLPFVSQVIPSEANFLLCEMTNAQAIHDLLTRQGILVRAYSDARLTNWLRISIGSAEEIAQLEQALRNQNTNNTDYKNQN